MSNAMWAIIAAIILAAPPAIVFTFSNLFSQGDLWIFNGGSLMNEAPAPVAGAGFAMLLLCIGVGAIVRRFRRKQVEA